LNFGETALTEAVEKRGGNKLPDRKEVYGKGDDADKEYYDNVFDQLINLWKDNEKIRQIMLDERLGKMAAQLSGADGIRIWHDQALIKKPGPIPLPGTWIHPIGHSATEEHFPFGLRLTTRPTKMAVFFLYQGHIIKRLLKSRYR
jgi:hypothetical protein